MVATKCQSEGGVRLGRPPRDRPLEAEPPPLEADPHERQTPLADTPVDPVDILMLLKTLPSLAETVNFGTSDYKCI